MNSYKLLIVSPHGKQYEGDVLRLDIRGKDGELAVMAGHVPFVTPVCEGRCRVQLTDQTEQIGHIANGLLNVTREKTTLMTGKVVWEDRRDQ